VKAVFLNKPGRLEINDLPVPQIRQATEVLLRMKAVGVCGSDLHYFRCGKIGAQEVTYPWIIGHECIAVVEAVGPEVTKVAKGDSVSVDPLVVCGHCEQCLAGRKHTCRNQAFLGCPGQLQGCMAEYLVIPQDSCFSIDPSLSPGAGVMIEPLAISIYALQTLDSPKEKTIAILGTGPIGLCVLIAARHAGVREIYTTEKLAYRADAAAKLGASWSGVVTETDIVEDILTMESRGLDAVFDCSGEQSAFDQAVQVLRPGGTLLIVGIPEVDRVCFDIHQLRRKEITIKNIRRQNECVPAAIRLAGAHTAELATVVTHHFRMPESQQAYEMVADYRDGVIKALIHFG
jgi:L-iditol 2-dehydrogenase